MKVNSKLPCCSFCLDPIGDEVKDQFILPDFQYSTQYKQLQFCCEECKAERFKICESVDLDANVYFQEYPEEKRLELVYVYFLQKVFVLLQKPLNFFCLFFRNHV
jgi:hypothetical protein